MAVPLGPKKIAPYQTMPLSHKKNQLLGRLLFSAYLAALKEKGGGVFILAMPWALSQQEAQIYNGQEMLVFGVSRKKYNKETFSFQYPKMM